MAQGFETARRAIQGVEGWLTDEQALRLFERARRLRFGQRIVEIGSYRGRSAIVLARGAPPGVHVIAIDPHAGNDRGPQQIRGTADEGQRDHEQFRRNLERAGVAGAVEHVRLPSSEALGAVHGAADLIYVDGAHRYRPAREDIARWGERVAPGGTLLVHDAFSSVGVTLAILRVLVPWGRFRYLGRTGSLAEYRRERLSRAEWLVSALRQLAELPWFMRNVAVKIALLFRLHPLAVLLGHRSRHWPY
jgi:predicted O-methyltransferase YrrM